MVFSSTLDSPSCYHRFVDKIIRQHFQSIYAKRKRIKDHKNVHKGLSGVVKFIYFSFKLLMREYLCSKIRFFSALKSLGIEGTATVGRDVDPALLPSVSSSFIRLLNGDWVGDCAAGEELYDANEDPVAVGVRLPLLAGKAAAPLPDGLFTELLLLLLL